MPPPGLTPAPTRTDHASRGKAPAVGAALITRYVNIAMANRARYQVHLAATDLVAEWAA